MADVTTVSPSPLYSACITAADTPFWIDGLSPSTRYSVRVGAKPAPPQQSKVAGANGVLFDRKCEDADSSSVWAWSSPVEFTTAPASEWRVTYGVSYQPNSFTTHAAQVTIP
jgi:hypothetical protein